MTQCHNYDQIKLNIRQMTRVEIQEDPKKVKKVPDNKMKDK